jgi:hypothetical protein
MSITLHVEGTKPDEIFRVCSPRGLCSTRRHHARSGRDGALRRRGMEHQRLPDPAPEAELAIYNVRLGAAIEGVRRAGRSSNAQERAHKEVGAS